MNEQVKIEKVIGKWYVCDVFSQDGQPVSGPFDTKQDAENERRQLNIADDCFVARYHGVK